MEVNPRPAEENNQFIVTGEESTVDAERTRQKRPSRRQRRRLVYPHHPTQILT